MAVDEIPEPYKAFMRWWDGSISEVQWFFTDQNAPVLELATPFRSGHQTPDNPFDMGCVGEIPERFIRPSTITRPNWVVTCCHVGDDVWWTTGWPSGTPGVVLVDGFAEGCGGLVPVTSVGLDMPVQYGVANSPITGSGTLIVTWNPVAANLVLAGPATGPSAVPTFRPLQPADLPPLNITAPVAQLLYLVGTPLSSLSPFGGYTPVAGDRILTWDGVTASTWGIWIASVGSWVRAADMPSGLVVSGPFYVWVLDQFSNIPGQMSLVVVRPSWSIVDHAPYTWTVGVDDVSVNFAVPASVVGAGIGTSVTHVVMGNFNLWEVNVLPGYPASNLGSGALPSGVTLPANQLTTPGPIPAGITIPASQVTGLPGTNIYQVTIDIPVDTLTGSPVTIHTFLPGEVIQVFTAWIRDAVTFTGVPPGTETNVQLYIVRQNATTQFMGDVAIMEPVGSPVGPTEYIGDGTTLVPNIHVSGSVPGGGSWSMTANLIGEGAVTFTGGVVTVTLQLQLFA